MMKAAGVLLAATLGLWVVEGVSVDGLDDDIDSLATSKFTTLIKNRRCITVDW